MRILILSTLLVFLSPVQLTASASGVDQRIEQRLAGYIAGTPAYSHVRYTVDDAIVSLSGTVALHSERRALVLHVRHMAEVAGVRNQILLDPPPVPDETLYHAVHRQLSAAGHPEIKFAAHEGWVRLAGELRTEHDRDALIALVQNTAGVKEVESHLRVEER